MQVNSVILPHNLLLMRYTDRLVKLFAIALLLATPLLMTLWGNKGQNKITAQKPMAHLPCKTLYKTIQQSDNAIGLIGFELHEGEMYSDGERVCPTVNAIIGDLDANSDEYKSLCRDIVADIISTCGDREVRINIYDSSEAYQLAVDAEQGVRMLTVDEEIYANQHRVATYGYSDECYDDRNFYLTFYPDASGKVREHEVFTFQRTI